LFANNPLNNINKKIIMKTLVQKIFGNTVNNEVKTLSAFPNSRLQEVSREIQKKLELKRAAEMTDDQKIALEIAAIRAKAAAKIRRAQHSSSSSLISS
jgi:citrate lyase gamma subunit